MIIPSEIEHEGTDAPGEAMRFKIPKHQPTSFRASARYLAGRTKGVEPDRVEWCYGQNLHTDDPDAAAAVMDATASRNTRCQAPAYHFILTFDPKDAKRKVVTPKIMREIADDALKRLDLAEHQALIYAHRDTDHPHIHFLVNRIHPQHGRAYSRHEDGKRLTALCREVARERGLNIPKAREYLKERLRVERFDSGGAPEMPTDGEYWRARRLKEDPGHPFPKEQLAGIRDDLRPLFNETRNWDDLSGKLLERGFMLRAKGQGMIVTDGASYAKLSYLGKGIRLSTLEKRFGEKFPDYELRMADRLNQQAGRDDLNDDPAVDERVRRQMERRQEVKRYAALERKDRVQALDDADLEYRYWSWAEECLHRSE